MPNYFSSPAHIITEVEECFFNQSQPIFFFEVSSCISMEDALMIIVQRTKAPIKFQAISNE